MTKRYIAIITVILMLFMRHASAEVITTVGTEGYGNYMYIAGSPDNYPIEFYDDESEAYRGVIPDILSEISDKSGINFVYINGDKSDKKQLGENLQVDIVSSETGIKNTAYGKEFLELISYRKNGKTIRYGLAFTEASDRAKTNKIKSTAKLISSDEKNGIYLSYASEYEKTGYKWLIIITIISLMLLACIVFLIVYIKKVQRKNSVDKMTDAETGLGNLQFFKYHFRYTIGDISRNLYHIAYIILDSSYLRSYHGDSSFEEVLRYTASVLSEYTGDREISARITENGFAFAFQAVNPLEARKRLEELMTKLNSFGDVKEKNNKLVFHSAVFHLSSADRNCEILLFNLRKNCNKIFGTDKQIIYCSTHSMNMIQEEKKITESILSGFEKNEFKMYLQFIVDNKTKQITSAEALSRWDSKEKGLLGPGKYIGNMESAGLISRHDFYMFELVCGQLERWRNTDYKDIIVSCNFTRITLSDDNFIDKIKMISNSYDFDRSRLAIEITEDAIEKDREAVTRNVTLCKELGFRVYLDDLGSGYTSLSNLCDYPIDIVKIDRDILLKTDNSRGKELFSGIIALAHSMNTKVICEGVETEEQEKIVSSSDCDYIQGWYYAKPLPIEECETFINKYKPHEI